MIDIKSSGLGFWRTLLILFIAFKLAGIIVWPWWKVLWPIWVGPIIVIGFILLMVAIWCFAQLLEKICLGNRRK